MAVTVDEAATPGGVQTVQDKQEGALPQTRGVTVLKQGWLHKLSYRHVP